jgi:hypothetical protein
MRNKNILKIKKKNIMGNTKYLEKGNINIIPKGP